MLVIEDSANKFWIVVEIDDPALSHVYFGVPAKRLGRAEAARVGLPFVPRGTPSTPPRRQLIRKAATKIVFRGEG